MPEPDAALELLVTDGLLERRDDRLRTTRRWQSALARATARLLQDGGDGDDLRVPIAAALVEVYGDSTPSDRIVELVRAILPIERLELA